MATKYECDRCRKLFTQKNKVTPIHYLIPGSGVVVKDICIHCNHLLRSFMAGNAIPALTPAPNPPECEHDGLA